LPLGEGPTSAVLRRREPVLLHGEAEFDLVGERRDACDIARDVGATIIDRIVHLASEFQVTL